jgi:L-fuconolactonase
MLAMPRIDAHQHYWHYDPVEYAWLDDSMRALRRDFTPQDALREMRGAGFERSIAVQVRQSLEETRWMLGLAEAHPFIAGVVGWVDLRSPAVEADLEAVAPHRKLIGVRHIVQAEPDGFLASPEFRRGVSRLDRFGLTYDLLIYARQLPEALAFVRALPEQRIVVDHLAKPDIKGGGFDSWRGPFAALAEFPRVWCKLSGLATEADRDRWTPNHLRPYIQTALDCFGPDRLMIGSDWPVCTVAGSYARTMQAIESALAEYTPAERASVLGGTAQRLWNL